MSTSLKDNAPASVAVFPFELVRPQLQGVENAIRQQAEAFDPGVAGYVSYVCETSGKRIRPALALLAGGATGAMTEQHTRLSVILEMIHIASLVHDDIISRITESCFWCAGWKG